MTLDAATIPMQSVRMGPGLYEVLGTSRAVEVRWAYREGERGDPVRDGWHLIVDGEWSQWYPTKREALQACQRDPEL